MNGSSAYLLPLKIFACVVPSSLQSYINIDVYGLCVNSTECAKFNMTCERDLMAPYKFYLSFENSICTDYITEKFFKMFRPDHFLIPVVRGGGDYSRYFPAETFINAADFDSPRHLAEHLRGLGSDTKRYAQMLEQKDLYRMNGYELPQCALCEYLNTKEISKQKSVDLKEWWSDGHCHEPHDLEENTTESKMLKFETKLLAALLQFFVKYYCH